MQHFLPIGEIKFRADAIGLTMGRLAALADVAPSTVGARAGDMRTSTLQKLSAALIAEELRLRDYLLGLHPVPPEPAPATENHEVPA